MPDVFTYTSLINGFSKLEQMDKAIEVVGKMKAQGITPNAVTYSAIINSLVKLSMAEKAIEVCSL